MRRDDEDRQWQDLDRATREDLDARYLKELEAFHVPGLSEEGVRRYLEYRHERPGASITTYGEGQIRRMLHGLGDPSAEPDPVAEEEHVGRLECFGAERLHFTNVGTYLAVMLSLIVGGVLLWLAWSISG